MWEPLCQWFSEPGTQKLSLGIIVGLIAGLIAGRLTIHRDRNGVESLAKLGDRAFFKGIQYILSNEHDQAIEEFTKSVQINSDTIETYVALGNLYRSKGEIDRAIRIRQSIIMRPNIDEQIKLHALFDLGVDYRKGGFLSQALETFSKVLHKQPSDMETLKEVEKIYEEMRDWENAFEVRQKIARLVKGDHGYILAHHMTEIGKNFFNKGDISSAKSSFKSAISFNERCVDAYLHLGDLYFYRQEYDNAMATWKKVVNIAPHYTFLAYRRLEGAYAKMKNLKPVEEFLKECALLHSDAFTHLALARYLHNEQDYQGALRELRSALELDPSFWEARKFMGEIFLSQGMKENALAAFKEMIPLLNAPYLKFQCSNCGFRPSDLCWKCPQCRQWDTIEFMDYKGVDSYAAPQHQKPLSQVSRTSQEESP